MITMVTTHACVCVCVTCVFLLFLLTRNNLSHVTIYQKINIKYIRGVKDVTTPTQILRK